MVKSPGHIIVFVMILLSILLVQSCKATETVQAPTPMPTDEIYTNTPTGFMYPLILFFITLGILFFVKPIVVWKFLVLIINKERDLFNMPQKDFLPKFTTLLIRIFSGFIGLICLLLAIILTYGLYIYS